MARLAVGDPVLYICAFCGETHEASAPRLFHHGAGFMVPVVRGHCVTTGHTIFQMGEPVPIKQAIKKYRDDG